ncbi:MAG: hypothetical protein GDA43_08725 [Hormoscilla sp. SP5CHS1]|nr:hypothetical protein [Hormoscilla sp. SP12CHS1]MBC6453283.1 hypothetical protein [Hormoscilla sp. SP5CHS1]
MLKSTINQTWEKLDKLSIASLESIGIEHLQDSNFTIFGYWDEQDNFYEKVILKQPLSVELSSYALGKNLQENPAEYWIELKYLLKNNLSVESETKISPDNPIGEMTLILDANFNFIDENWSLDIDSPLITAKLEKEEGID